MSDKRRWIAGMFVVSWLAFGPLAVNAARVSYKYATVAGVKIFYREAGDPAQPTIVLLHGFPSSSFEFHALIPLLSDRFHVLAPDYPGMGFSEAPPANGLTPSFDNLATTMAAFIGTIGQGRPILYMHDFGGPVGMRIADKHPELIAGLIFQNTTISLDGYNPARLKVFERIGGPETPAKLAEAEAAASIGRDVFLHRTGAHDAAALDPDDWAVDAYAFGIPEDKAFMARLLMDIGSNVRLYPQWETYMRTQQPKTLIVWGKNDPVFTPNAAETIKNDVPNAALHYYDGGHFVLDEYAGDIAREIVKTFSP